MASLSYYSYAGVGERNRQRFWYSQAVRFGNRIECAGQGGWDPKTGQIPADINAQIDQAFANVDLAIKTAGGKGWSQVFKVRSYHIPLDDMALAGMVRNLQKWCPNHQPIWTCVGVSRLGEEEMKVEIEVEAVELDQPDIRRERAEMDIDHSWAELGE
ncbi:NRAMP-like transporter smf-3 [Paramarasmius palmivorus]|uniref:NRAMP-like transporter smf-3 n=1 Tax=Paramarasmius palmivorus TaxID=297713 RepID=A0AAW0E0V5_9AGAR